MRLFIAIDLDPEIRERVAGYVEGLEKLAADVRWSRPEAWHITLKFIGEVNEEMVARIKEQLERISAAPAHIHFRGTGFFPTPRSPRVFWAGVEGDSNLLHLAESVERTLGAIGISFEERAFSPHLTLARSGSGSPSGGKKGGGKNKFEKLQERLSKMAEPDFGTMTARGFLLYQSKTSPKGAEYTKLARYELK
jgi:2'-5' RNA ligase